MSHQLYLTLIIAVGAIITGVFVLAIKQKTGNRKMYICAIIVLVVVGAALTLYRFGAFRFLWGS